MYHCALAPLFVRMCSAILIVDVLRWHHRTVDYLPLLEIYMVLSGAMKASLQGRDIQVSSSLHTSLCPQKTIMTQNADLWSLNGQHPRLRGHCRRGDEKTVRTRGSGSLL